MLDLLGAVLGGLDALARIRWNLGTPVLLLLIFAATALIGLAVRKLLDHRRQRLQRPGPVSWLVVGTAVLISLLLSSVTLLAWGLLIPASDDSKFQDQRVLSLSIPAASGDKLTLQLQLPRSLKVDEDAQVELQLPLGQQKMTSALRTSDEVKTRASAPCQGASAPAGEVTACGSLVGASDQRFRWFIRSTRPNASVAVVAFPAGLLMDKAQPSWKVLVYEDGQAWGRLLRGQSLPSSSGPVLRGSDHGPILAVTLSELEPVARHNGVEIDLRAGELTVPLQFNTTLGVTQTTYTVLAILGTILSALLGGGWLWQLVGRLHVARTEGPAKHVPLKARRPRE